MTRHSSIDKLPAQIREAIGKLRQDGHTIDEILAHLADMQSQVSRSALGRHIKGLDAIGEKMRRSRSVAEALVRELGDAPESRAARLNIELLHNTILDLFMRAADAEGDPAQIDKSGQAMLDGNPEGAMMLAKALESLSRASKTNVEFLAAAEKRATEKAKAEAVEAVESVAKTQGLTGDTVAAIKASIFGVKA